MTEYRIVFTNTGLGIIAAENQGMIGLISHQQIRLLRLLAERGAQERRSVHTALFGNDVLSNAQRASLSRSIKRLCAWGWERRHAYRLMDAALVVENVSNWTQTPPQTESQARPLTRLDPELQSAAWRDAALKHNGWRNRMRIDR